MSFGGFGFGEVAFGETSSGAVGGVGSGTFPALTADASGEAPPVISLGTVTASFAALSASSTAIVLAKATGDATFPQLEADVSMRAESRRRLREWEQCPRPAAGAWSSSCRPGSLRDGPGDGV